MDSYLDSFKSFDPLTDQLPESMRWTLRYVFQEAQFLLPPDFTREDLNLGLEIMVQLNRLKINVFAEFISPEMKERGLEEIDNTPAKDCFRATKYVEELPKRANGVGYTWANVFAVAALANIANCVEMASQNSEARYLKEDAALNEQLKLYETFSNPSVVVSLPNTAVEFLGFARLFADRAEKSRARTAGMRQAKIDHYHELKLAIVKSFNELPRPLSARKAAKQIYPRLDDSVKYRFATDDPVHQIEVWLGQYKNRALPGQDDLPPYRL